MMENLGLYHCEQYSLIISSHVPFYPMLVSTCLFSSALWLAWVAFYLPFFSLLAQCVSLRRPSVPLWLTSWCFRVRI